jgi:hypothetical protein
MDVRVAVWWREQINTPVRLLAMTATPILVALARRLTTSMIGCTALNLRSSWIRARLAQPASAIQDAFRAPMSGKENRAA